MATWPTSLPQSPKLRGYTESADSNVIRSSNEVGPANQRRRYTAKVKTFPISLVMTTTQLETFDTFLEGTIDDGALPFTWIHPRTLATASCRLRNVPNYNAQGNGYYLVTFQMEIVP